jgi:ubiquinone/menaquinone biosynthesis C-methylase UbiE
MPASPTESYLRAWHSRHADASSLFADAHDANGLSSYQRLARLATADASVLDLACGSGVLLGLIRESAPRAALVGIDFTMEELRLARGRVPDAHLSCASAQALPLSDASVELVVCHMALMLMDDADRVLAEVRRVLREGGTFSAVTNRPMVADEIGRTVLRALRPLGDASDAHLRTPPLGDVRTYEGAALSELAGAHFATVSVEPFEVTQHVARRDLWRFLVKAIYGVDAIPEDEGTRVLDELDLPDPVPWTVAMVQLHCREVRDTVPSPTRTS